MPYDPDNPPEKVKDLSPTKQRQWCEVFNSCWEKHHDEKKCHMMAWGVVKKSGSEGCGSLCEAMQGHFDAVLEGKEWKKMNKRQNASRTAMVDLEWNEAMRRIYQSREPEEMGMNRKANIAVARELLIVARMLSENPKQAGLIEDLRASKITAVVSKLFGRIIGLRQDIQEMATTLEAEAKDDKQVAAILSRIPVLKEVLRLGTELRRMATQIPRRDEVSANIVNVLTASDDHSV